MSLKPVKQFKLGRTVAAVWEHEHEGRTFFNVSFSQVFKQSDDAPWRRGHSFGRDELPLVAKVADQAHTWMYEEEQRRRQAKREAS